MLIEGTKILALPRGQVWQALNDPAFMQATVPGCRRASEPRPGELTMELGAAVGPIKVAFVVEVKKLDVRPPESYVLEGSGSGGVAGSATGRVQVRLSEVPGGTQLDYSATTEVTGRIAQLGSRLIDSTARKFSEDFFANVVKAMAPSEAVAATAPAAPMGAPTTAPVAVAAEPAPSRLALDGLAWRVALGCGLGSFAGTMAAIAIMRGT